MKYFDEAMKVATSKPYDYLDPRNVEFDKDYDTFMAKTDTLKDDIGKMIEKNYADVWETPQGFRFLIRFENVIPGCLKDFTGLCKICCLIEYLF